MARWVHKLAIWTGESGLAHHNQHVAAHAHRGHHLAAVSVGPRRRRSRQFGLVLRRLRVLVGSCRFRGLAGEVELEVQARARRCGLLIRALSWVL